MPPEERSRFVTSSTIAPHAVVVGAGIIGLATAWELRRRDWHVTVVDPEPASGASRAAAGMLAPIAEVVWDQPHLYPLMIEAGAMYPAFVESITRAVGHDIGYLATETLVCAADAADRQHLTDLAGLQATMGLHVEPLTPSAARRLEPALAPSLAGAMHIPSDHQVDPRQVMAALLGLLDGPEPGWRLVAERAVELVRAGDRVRGVRLGDGTTVEADETILCTGLDADLVEGWQGEGRPAWRSALRPVWGDVLRATVPAHLRPLVTRTIRGIVHGYPVYLVPRADGSLVIGATSREDDRAGVLAGGVHQLLRDAYRLVPGVLECEVHEMIARPRPGTPDDVPLIGRLGEGLVLSTGYFRHGILLAPLGARLGADLVCGDALDPATAAALDPYRFTTRR